MYTLALSFRHRCLEFPSAGGDLTSPQPTSLTSPHTSRIITRAQASARAAAARRRLDFDDDVRLLDAARAGGDEVSTDSDNSQRRQA